jgi:hypothetical protein
MGKFKQRTCCNRIVETGKRKRALFPGGMEDNNVCVCRLAGMGVIQVLLQR